MKIAIAGLGLIGGSLAKTISEKTNYQVDGYDICNVTVENAIKDGTIAKRVDSFSDYDIVFVALYPKATMDFLKNNVAEFSANSLIIDCCGVKSEICSKSKEIFSNSNAIFIGGHPMAGKEVSGYANSSANLFDNASMILTPPEEIPENISAFLKDFFLGLGFGCVTITTPEHHDNVIAYTSQLAHVVSSAYMLSPTAKDFSGFSAGSFADLTRVAKLNPEMWSQLFLANKDPLLDEIDSIIGNLKAFYQLIDSDDSQQLIEVLQQGSDIKESISAKGKMKCKP